jgi:protoporphyrinogen/coproporphyrinogen III oxidase
MKKVLIVGAGFSGLSLAFELAKKGLSVDIVDQMGEVGGMISTPQTYFGYYETSANGFLNTIQVEKFLKEINCDYVGSSEKAKKRFIYRSFPKRWPLNFKESCIFLIKILKTFLKGSHDRRPLQSETVKEWSLRLFTPEVTNYLIAPALQGIYAGDINLLSAEMVLGPMLNSKRSPAKKSKSSLLSAKDGMGAVMQQLKNSLTEKGVRFHFFTPWSNELTSRFSPDCTVIATSVFEAAKILEKMDVYGAYENFHILRQAESLPLTTATCFLKESPKDYTGFGILFPRSEKIRALGVLMNNIIFDRKSFFFTETWIFGGAKDKEIQSTPDNELREMIQKDRTTVFGQQQTIDHIEITRWPLALPHYTVEWQRQLTRLLPMKNVILHGNYLGSLGLSRILERSQEIATQLESRDKL